MPIYSSKSLFYSRGRASQGRDDENCFVRLPGGFLEVPKERFVRDGKDDIS
jgi:hypothetical protein